MDTGPVHLRPFREADLELLERYAVSPEFSLPFQWTGFQWPEGFRRRWEEDGFLGKDPHQLIVADAEGTGLGWVMWRDSPIGRPGTGACEIGALLAPEHRGQGAGTAGQRLLVEHVFTTTTTHRICALTADDNAAERRSLTKCGFCQEGVLREAGFRGGRRVDVIVYGVLRSDQSQEGG